MYHLEINYRLKIIHDMVISIDARKTFDKFNSQLVTKVLSKLEIKSNFLNMQKDYLQKILQLASHLMKSYKLSH